jgi:hypothetical protein
LIAPGAGFSEESSQGVDPLARGWILGDGCPQLIDGQFRPIFRHLISPQ